MNIILSIHPFIFCLSFLSGSKGSATIIYTQQSFRCRQVQFITEEKNKETISLMYMSGEEPMTLVGIKSATCYPTVSLDLKNNTFFLLYVLTTWSLHRLGTGQEGQHQLVVHYSSAAVPLVFIFIGRENMRQLLPCQVWT